MKCKDCGSENLKLRKVEPHIELFCGDCLTFQKFVTKADYKRLLIVLKNE